MKQILQVVAAVFLFAAINLPFSTAHAQGTAFTYQGQLQNNGSLASGTYNLQFTLYTNATSGSVVAGPLTTNGIAITNGLFTVTIDFGASAWNGRTNWLQVAVETNGAGSFSPLSPRQILTPTPYAIFAESAGTVSASQLGSIGNFPGTFDSYNFYIGPSGTSTTSGHYNTAIGVQAFVSNASGSGNTAEGVAALNSNTSGSDNTANGYVALVDNVNGNDNVANGVAALESNSSGNNNTANGFQALITDNGSDNTANGFQALGANNSGNFNTADGDSSLKNLGINGAGGTNNIALGYNAGSAFTGNESSNIDIGNVGVVTENNTIRIGSSQTATYLAGSVGIATTAVGELLQIGTSSSQVDGMIRLGCGNGSQYRIWDIGVPYGGVNTGGTNYSFIIRDDIAGSARLMIDYNTGDVCIGTTTPLGPLTVGTAYCSGTTWQNGSDRNSKKNFSPVNPREVLAKVAALPITQWQYKVEGSGIEHLGPMAQDFHMAFGLNGNDDKHISTVDEGGVALAAIQGLNQKLEEQAKEKDTEITDLKEELNELKEEVQSLKERN
jgi:hypothetical protein